MNCHRCLFAVAVLALMVVGCGKSGEAPAAASVEAHPGEPTAPITNRISIPPAVRQNLGITFAKVEYRVVQRTLRIPARVERDADARWTCSAPIDGLLELLVKPYQSVERGAPLATLGGRAWVTVREQWREATTLAAAPGAVPALAQRRDVLAADIARMAGVEAGSAALEALRDAPVLTLHARAAGVVEADIAQGGVQVQQGAALLQLSDLSKIRIRAVALQGDASALRPGMMAAIVPHDQPHSASVPARMQLGLEADPVARTFDVLAWPTAAPPAWLRPGMAVQLELRQAGGDEELAIPVAATITDAGSPVIFRRNPANADELIKLTGDLGLSDGVWVQVLSGLAEGDEVVLGGIYPLHLASASSGPQKAGHFHADGTWHEGNH